MRASVLVTGVGGNVGQGVLRVLRSLPHDLFIVGTNTSAVSGGNHLCDVVRKVPFSTDDGYVASLEQLCSSWEVQLIVPTTDLETVVLTSNRATLPPVAASPHDTCALFLDKWLTFQAFASEGIPFASSVLPSGWQGQFDSCIVKPRQGRGSRGISTDPEDPRAWSDDFVVQQRVEGPELTVGFYVDADRDLIGFIALERSLRAGATDICSTTATYDDDLVVLLRQISELHPIRGSCNVQLRADPKRGLVPFEVNCRISGTNAIRHLLGFRDVQYTLEEWLLGKKPDTPALIAGSATRLLMDVIYPGASLDDIGDMHTSHVVF